VATAGAALTGLIAVLTTFGRSLYVFTGDQAVLALGVQDALGLHAQLGPYSRFGWNHPGPAFSYLLAPLYAVSDHNPRAFFFGSLLINAAAAVSVVAVVRRRAGEWCSRASAALVCCAVLAAGVSTVTYFWNPDVEALPVLLVLVLGAAAIAGSGLSLVAMAVVGTYCVQTDVGTGPTVGVVSVLAALGYGVFVVRHLLARREEQRDYRRRSQVAALVAGVLGVALLAVMWIPPLHQQATGHPGNLSALIDFFRGHTHHVVGARHHPVGTAINAVAVTATQLPYGGDGALSVLRGATTGELALFWASVAVGAGAVALGLWRRNLFAVGLALASLAGLGTAVLAATHVVGPLYPYLMSWATYLALPAWLAAGWLVAGLIATALAARRRSGRHAGAPRWSWGWVRPALSGVAAAALLVPPAALAYQFTVQVQGAHDSGDTPVSQLAAFTRAALGSSLAGRRPLVVINSGNSWPVAAGLVWQLEREGLHPKVPPQWGFMFGRNRVDRRLPPAVVAVADTSTVPPGARAGPNVLTVNDPLYGPTTLTVTAPHPAPSP
jgi:hypothetical protein